MESGVEVRLFVVLLWLVFGEALEVEDAQVAVVEEGKVAMCAVLVIYWMWSSLVHEEVAQEDDADVELVVVILLVGDEAVKQEDVQQDDLSLSRVP